ncbi:MAG: SWIM zinc finger family protein [Halobacteriaceae archaeon]
MSEIAPERRALRPDDGGDSRAARARSEPMAVVPLGGGRYDVVTGDDTAYTVDVRAGRCTCPDHRHRDARCKHLRRVALDVTENRVPAPDERAAACAACGDTTFVARETAAPVYCADCTLAPGDFAVDEATDDLLAVVRTTDRRADETPIPGTGHTVASYPGNSDYEDADAVVEAVYPVPADPERVSARPPTVYSFPRGRLRRAGVTPRRRA